MISLSAMHTGEVNAIEQQGKIGRSESDVMSVFACEFLKRSLFKSLVPDGESVPIPVEQLDAILSLVDECEQSTIEHIFANVLFDHPQQPVETFAHVCRQGAEINVIRQAQHAPFSIAFKMAEMVVSSQPEAMRTVVPLA